MSAQTLWDSFCDRFGVIESSVPLFAMSASGVVQTRKIGKDGRHVLLRSPEMEALIIRETRTLLDDWRTGTHRYDGLIYFMGWRRGDRFVPLYIGKAETLGKGKGNLSANIRGIENDRSKFARWGDNYAYHVGDLSACVLGHDAAKRTIKYQSWAETIFKTVPCEAPTLLEPVYFLGQGLGQLLDGRLGRAGGDQACVPRVPADRRRQLGVTGSAQSRGPTENASTHES